MRKTFIKLMLILCLIFIATTGVVLYKRTKQDNNSVASNATPSIQSNHAISEGLAYLDAAPDTSPLNWLVIDYLRRKYHLDGVYKIRNRDLISEAENNSELKVYLRLAYPDKLVDSLPVLDEIL